MNHGQSDSLSDFCCHQKIGVNQMLRQLASFAHQDSIRLALLPDPDLWISRIRVEDLPRGQRVERAPDEAKDQPGVASRHCHPHFERKFFFFTIWIKLHLLVWRSHRKLRSIWIPIKHALTVFYNVSTTEVVSRMPMPKAGFELSIFKFLGDDKY